MHEVGVTRPEAGATGVSSMLEHEAGLAGVGAG